MSDLARAQDQVNAPSGGSPGHTRAAGVRPKAPRGASVDMDISAWNPPPPPPNAEVTPMKAMPAKASFGDRARAFGLDLVFVALLIRILHTLAPAAIAGAPVIVGLTGAVGGRLFHRLLELQRRQDAWNDAVEDEGHR